MNERLPYEESFHQQLKEILLPDENLAWEDMKRRLQKDDDITPVIAWWRRGCMLWGILIAALFSMGLYWYYSNKKLKNNLKQSGIQKNISVLNKKDTVSTYPDENKSNTKRSDSTVFILDTAKKTSNNYLPDEEKKYKLKQQESQSQEFENKKRGKKIRIKSKSKTKTTVKTPQSENDKLNDATINDEVETMPGKNDSESVKIDSSILVSKSAKIIKESIKDSVIKKISIADSSKKESSKKKTISVSAGLALHQQIPVNGQTLTPYNSLGRKGTLRDYIPSVYVRLNKNDKWFIQSGFRYGAPQNNKATLFDQQIDSVPFSSKIQTASTSIKKTYYHQLPLTFNYFITPNWSFGTGVVWNKFYSAITEQNAVQHDYISGADSIIKQGFISRRNKADSNFSKSFFQGLIETQYKWKRFSFGISYAQGLQPYIKFKLPGEAEKKERNSSFQIFIRYEIWKSKK
ncbi:MAG: hypothetical protein ABI091_17905 [Ferruginibacter sp.]